MTRCQQVGRPIVRCLRQGQLAGTAARTAAATPASAARYFSWSASRRADDAAAETPAAAAPKGDPSNETRSTERGPAVKSNDPKDADFARRKLDPNTTTMHWAERALIKSGTFPVGSRRRRAAIRTSANVPFEQLPYQCFQEARKILQEDRADKVRQLVAETGKIRAIEATPADQINGGERMKQMRLKSLRQYVEELKILADINDPLVKRRFEDGMGDMNKPIYRHLGERKWRSYARKVTVQRVEQFHIVPDVLPKFEPTMAVDLYFRGYKVSPGETLDSAVSEVTPRLRVQYFDRTPRLASVVVMDSDVPSVEADGFARRCHYLAANIPLAPTTTSVPLAAPNMKGDLAVPWLPAFSQKGSPYHRLSAFVLLQPEGVVLDVPRLRELYDGAGRDGFSLKSYRDKFDLTPAGFSLFRTVWDRNTALVMARHGIPGADVEFKPTKVEPLRTPKKARGWEAKRQKPKYRSLWKYTKRIA